VSWWRAEGDAKDWVGPNSGSLGASVAFTSGVVGQAFHFDGRSHVTAGAQGLPTPGQSATLEAWVRVTGAGALALNTVFRYGNWVGPVGGKVTNYDLNESAGLFQALRAATTSTAVRPNVWAHVAVIVTRISNALSVTLILNGGAATSSANFAAATGALTTIIGGPNGAPFTGDIDELSFYSRALSLSEISAIQAAGPAGKCPFAKP
jgi:hypothetical protein